MGEVVGIQRSGSSVWSLRDERGPSMTVTVERGLQQRRIYKSVYINSSGAGKSGELGGTDVDAVQKGRQRNGKNA